MRSAARGPTTTVYQRPADGAILFYLEDDSGAGVSGKVYSTDDLSWDDVPAPDTSLKSGPDFLWFDEWGGRRIFCRGTNEHLFYLYMKDDGGSTPLKLGDFDGDSWSESHVVNCNYPFTWSLGVDSENRTAISYFDCGVGREKIYFQHDAHVGTLEIVDNSNATIIAINSDDLVYIIYTAGDLLFGPPMGLYYKTYNPDTDTLSGENTIWEEDDTATQILTDIDAEVDTEDNVHIIFTRVTLAAPGGAQLSSAPYHMVIGDVSPELIDNSSTWMKSESLAIDNDNNLNVALLVGGDSGVTLTGAQEPINFIQKPYGGSWGSLEDVGGVGGYLGLVSNSTGEFFIVYDRGDGGARRVYYMEKPSGGEWTGETTVSELDWGYPNVIHDQFPRTS